MSRVCVLQVAPRQAIASTLQMLVAFFQCDQTT